MSGKACAIRAVVSPIPKPISSTVGASRPKTAVKSSAAGWYAMPNRGSSVSTARDCAGDVRPCRST